MASVAEKNEAEILRALRSRYEKDGYTFLIHPAPELVPDFLRGYQPDALALSKRGSIVIEVKSQRSGSGDRTLAQVAERIAGRPDWKLEVFYAPSFLRPVYGRANQASIAELVNEVEVLADAGYLRAALLVGWSTLEAIARALNPNDDEGGRAMIPSEVIDWLAQAGHIPPATARYLRNLIKVRNAAAHGVTDIPIRLEDVAMLRETLAALKSTLDQDAIP